MWIVILLSVMAAVAARPDGDHYDKKYENFNAKEVTENLKLLNSYVKCFLGKGKCTPEGNDFKRWIPESVRSKCGKCTEKQKSHVAIFIKAIREKLPDDWKELSKEYDPKGEYIEQLNQFIQQYTAYEK